MCPVWEFWEIQINGLRNGQLLRHWGHGPNGQLLRHWGDGPVQNNTKILWMKTITCSLLSHAFISSLRARALIQGYLQIQQWMMLCRWGSSCLQDIFILKLVNMQGSQSLKDRVGVSCLHETVELVKWSKQGQNATNVKRKMTRISLGRTRNTPSNSISSLYSLFAKHNCKDPLTFPEQLETLMLMEVCLVPKYSSHSIPIFSLVTSEE